MHGLVEFAMSSGMLTISRDPVSLVRNADFHIPTASRGKSWSGHRRPLESGTSVRTLSGPPTALGWAL
jgi:hypothetical protein